MQPPAFKRPARNEHRLRPARSSRALPDSNPFAIPATSMIERLAPVARFLTLFLLFTAIGTFVLSTMKDRPSQPPHDHILPPTEVPGVQERLEPTFRDDHPTIATPKVFGPLGASANVDFNKAADETVKGIEIESTATLEAAQNPSFPESGEGEGPLSIGDTLTPQPSFTGSESNLQSHSGDPTASTERLPTLVGADGGPLPRVQTTELPASSQERANDTASARFTGSIQSNDEPGLESSAKPPAFARRLPAIFEAPRNAHSPLPAVKTDPERGYQ
jgi:hypothetical protein